MDQEPTAPSIAFFTSVWERDWPIVLDERRMEASIASSQWPFEERLVVLNNFKSDRSFGKAKRKAEELVDRGIVTEVVDHREVLTDDALTQMGLEPEKFWRCNPFFSSGHLAGIRTLQDKAEYAFFLNGDVWLDKADNWVPRALSAMQTEPDIRGVNLCRNIYRHKYPEWCDQETDELWIAKPPPPRYPVPHKGFSLGDHAYFIPLKPDGSDWRFDNSEQLEPFTEIYPDYARPCFEAFVACANGRDGKGFVTLKPKPGPMTKHKKGIPDNRLKLAFYLAMGFYKPGAKWGPPAIASSG